METERHLAELGITLPDVPQPLGSYVPWVRTGNLLYTSGIGPRIPGGYAYAGQVGAQLTVAQGQDAARVCMLNLLSIVKLALGDLDRVVQVVKVLGFVASPPGFGDQPEVMNGASDLLGQVFGERGRHARSAIGVSSLPKGIPVEIEMILEVVPMPGQAQG